MDKSLEFVENILLKYVKIKKNGTKYYLSKSYFNMIIPKTIKQIEFIDNTDFPILLKLIYTLLDNIDFEIRYFRFYKLSRINKEFNKYNYFVDMAEFPTNNYKILISFCKVNNNFFFRLEDGNTEFSNYINYKYFKKFLKKNDKYLYDFESVLEKIINNKINYYSRQLVKRQEII